MKITHDLEVDILRILFSNTRIEESDEDKPGVILDYDKAPRNDNCPLLFKHSLNQSEGIISDAGGIATTCR